MKTILVAVLAVVCTSCGSAETVDAVEERQPTEDVSEPVTVDVESAMVPCKKHGIPCMEKCAIAGVSCAAAVTHPYFPSHGRGDLSWCIIERTSHQCVYTFEKTGNTCKYFVPRKMAPLCVYRGGLP